MFSRREYASQGIRVKTLAFGVIRTPVYPVEALAGMHPLGRMGEIYDVVEAIMPRLWPRCGGTRPR
ncbi:hypothetical protein [Streptomyces collinus]|uniref:hypothetical protein n=1 Tax=Streptomyces collinus TaxID=42684 RepID=UPI00331F80A3